MTRNIYLKGKMGKLFGEHWKLNASTVREAMNGIDVQREGKLKQYLIDCTEKGIEFTVQRGEDFLEYDNLQMELGNDDIIITPLPVGAGKTAGRIKAIIGIALIVIGVLSLMSGNPILAVGAWYLIGAGALLASIGIVEMLTPDTPSNSKDGYLFNGPENSVKQGIPVPLCYGELIVGGAPINFGFTDRRADYASGFSRVTVSESGYGSHDTYGRYQTITNNTGGTGGGKGDDGRSGGSDTDFSFNSGK
jgi:predicted phage tail protein